ncbi:hypothetical protein NHQ30_000866 [Ciborinia camelliae]|nr:hypothetical protein NHQ30_000866 [Ciborinia camelliae]
MGVFDQNPWIREGIPESPRVPGSNGIPRSTGIQRSPRAPSPRSPRVPSSIGIPPSVYTPRTSLPGLLDKLAGPQLWRWRVEHWPGGLNAGDCRVSPSFGLGGRREGERGGDGDVNQDNGSKRDGWGDVYDNQRPKYIIHTHAPNFADRSYSAPLVKQLLVNCYRGALVEAMGIAEREEEEQEREQERERKQRDGEEHGDKSSEINTEDTIMTNANADRVAEIREGGVAQGGSLVNVGVGGSFSSPASLASPRTSITPTPTPTPLPSIPSIPSLPIPQPPRHNHRDPGPLHRHQALPAPPGRAHRHRHRARFPAPSPVWRDPAQADSQSRLLRLARR